MKRLQVFLVTFVLMAGFIAASYFIGAAFASAAIWFARHTIFIPIGLTVLVLVVLAWIVSGAFTRDDKDHK